MIDDEGKARITDFGLINITESQAYNTSHTVLTDRGSVRWTAPELFEPQMRTTRFTDVYAFGMTILEVITSFFQSILFSCLICVIQMYTRSPPFKELCKDVQVITAVSKGRRPEHPGESVYMEDGLWNLITSCWETDPKDRPHIRKAVEKVSDQLNQPFLRISGISTVSTC
jgi:serine/threonine protein kinase